MSEFLTIPSNINSSIRTKNLHIKTNINKPNENLIKKKSRILSLLSLPKSIIGENYNEREKQKNQKNFLNSLLTKNKSRKIIGFEQYNSILSKSLNHYKSKGLTDEEISEINTNRNIKEENTRRNLSTNKFQININDFDFKNPFQSLNVINDNNSVFNHISRDVLLRQRNLFNRSIEVLEGNLQKFNVKMPKIKVSDLNTKISDEISMINLIDNKEEENTNTIPSVSGELRLFSYFRYPHKNFPEGRSQFSICIKENNIIISGGLSSNMNTMQLWSLNIQKLQWYKIRTNNTTHCRYGHTSTYFQNKIYYFGGKSKEGSHDILLGLEIYNISDKSFIIPQDIIDPKLRRNHVSCLIGQQILFHGGIDLDNEVLDDCLLLNLNPLKWIKLAINNYSHMPRVYGHTSCLVVPSNILVYSRFNVYRYPDEESPSDRKSKGQLKQRGLYIFGGKTSEGELSNDLWVLILGQKPVYWEKVKTNGTPPSPRYCHTMDYYEKSNFLIIHGGRNDYLSSNSALDDTYILDLHNLGWVKIKLYSNIPNFKVFSRYGHKSILFSNKLIILGGVNNNNYVGSCLFIVNLDFYYNTKIKSEDQILFENLKNNKNNKNNENENDDKINKMKRKFRKSLKELGIVSPIVLPPIK